MSKADTLSDEELRQAIDAFVERTAQFFNAEVAEEKARETRFVQRESKLTGHLFLTIFTFGMSLYGTPTLNQLAGLLSLVLPELDITREGVHQRITEQAVSFFEAMLSLAIELELPTDLELSALEDFARILLFDSTSFQLPETLAPYFTGSGGAASEAGLKILFGYDLKSAQFVYVLLNGTDADHLLENGAIDAIGPADLEISDLGYFGVEAFAAIDGKGAFYLSRLKSNVTLYQKNTAGELEAFDLVQFLKGLQDVQTEIEVYLKSQGTVIQTRLIVERVPDDVKAQRLRKINARNKARGHQTQQRTKVLQGFNLHITNTPPEVLPMEVVRKLYTIRWQIELVFKNWKSNFGLDKVTGERPERIKCMLYAKLLFIFITTKLVRVASLYAWRKFRREVSEFQAANHIAVVGHEWMRAIIKQPNEVKAVLTRAFDFIIKHCLKCKSQKRTYPLEILAMIDAHA